VLEEKLKGRGYPVYVAEAKNPVAGEIWYRVFVGHYKDKQLALGMAFQIKEQDHLNGVVVWKEESPKVPQ
jgi:cell division septation protein DedD